MLHFFRKHQKFFFLFTTIIIVVSFIFFGTYQAFAPTTRGQTKDKSVAFCTVDGKKIRNYYFNTLKEFLSSENWMAAKKIQDVNFLNDGVISKDFLETGFAKLLASNFSAEYVLELQKKHAREKEFSTYIHPKNPFLSAQNIWSVFAPEIPEKLTQLKQTENPASVEGFSTRVDLFLAERKFPPSYLTQIIRYQEKESIATGSDTRLQKETLSLFGYEDLNDWFGASFIDQVSHLVLQGAAVARKKGYTVSSEEALADLYERSGKMYEMLSERMPLPFQDGKEFFHAYVNQRGWEDATIVKIWQEVLLFRRIFHEVGHASLPDLFSLQSFYASAHENATLEVYQLPPELHLHTYEQLKKFETYLAAVGKEKKSPLDIPEHYADLAIIEKKAEELVGKKFELFVLEVQKKDLQSKVSLKETWEWENQIENWKRLQKEFSFLADKKGSPLDILDSLGKEERKKVDVFASGCIISAHPEWIEEKLKEDTLEEKILFLNAANKEPLPGIKDVKAFVKLLEEQDEVIGYTQDQEHFFRFLVKKRPENLEILTFKEASRGDVLDLLSKRFEIEDQVQKVIDALSHLYPQKGGVSEKKGDFYAIYRCVPLLQEYRSKPEVGGIRGQWEIIKKDKTFTRSEPGFIPLQEILKQTPGELSEIAIDAQEGPYYYRLLEKKKDSTFPIEKALQAQELLSLEARWHYFKNFLKL